MKIKFWVRDKDRMVSVTMGDDTPSRDGFREVTDEEFDAFREETKNLNYPSAKAAAKLMKGWNK